MKHKNLLIFIIIVLILTSVYFIWKTEILNLYHTLNQGEASDIVSIIQSWGIWAPILSVLLMILQAIIAPIPSFLITGANGIVFGVFWGIIISWIGAMFGAAITYYLARLLGEEFVKKKEKNSNLLKTVSEMSDKKGYKVVFIARLLPFISFDFISYAAGLSTMKPWKFFLATALGMIPGTILYVFFGRQIVLLSQYSLLFTLLFITLIIIYIAISYYKNQQSKERENENK
ncbi:MAG: TVP38/TMEM64 family protein [Acholeplasmataceae bacterium]